jgi:hypothetical protein
MKKDRSIHSPDIRDAMSKKDRLLSNKRQSADKNIDGENLAANLIVA